MKAKVKIAVVGDVHDQWEAEDRIALEQLGIDLVLFVGDFGNEAIAIVREVAATPIPFAAILGNHDAWYTTSPWGRKKTPYDPTKVDRVREQLAILGEAHVGYGKRDFPELGLSVVGSRPFSWGGAEWSGEQFFRDRYNIEGFLDSSDRIVAAAKETTQETLIFLAHNGPYGLGDRPEDICGRDWKPLGGDHGDSDLADAIARTCLLNKRIPLVTFGHMHQSLRHTQERQRKMLKIQDDTFYVNAAHVPRIISYKGETRRNFSLVTLQDGEVENISLVWVGENYQIVSEEIFYNRTQ
ncbi:MAG: TIGR04168 family protein [Cyanobacteria bacterium SBLK]|nr:TIGR04168 family protein [Cyanobacteria bacterium SBLK]